jgi:hypothetical protein
MITLLIFFIHFPVSLNFSPFSLEKISCYGIELFLGPELLLSF